MLFSLFAFQVSAAIDPEVLKISSDSLVKLGIMVGDEKGNLNLKNNVKRCEFLALVIRTMGYEQETDTSEISIPFKDISKKHWAFESIKIALKHELVSGYPDNTVKPDANVSFAEAQAILLRALGYEKTLVGKWPDNVLNKASELGLNKSIDLKANKELTRGEAAVLIYNSLIIDFKS